MTASYIAASFAFALIASGCSPNDESFSMDDSSYRFVNKHVGCASRFTDERKQDAFDKRYKDHWMTWTGRIDVADSDTASIDMDGHGLQDLYVRFKAKGAGYNLYKGQTVIVQFLMKERGGCVMPFSGERATLVAQRPFRAPALFEEDDALDLYESPVTVGNKVR